MADIKKSTLIKEIACETNIEEAVVKLIIDTFICRIKIHMLSFKSVLITGLGTFLLKDSKPKAVADFSTGLRKTTPERKLPKCNFSQTFKKEIKK